VIAHGNSAKDIGTAMPLAELKYSNKIQN